MTTATDLALVVEMACLTEDRTRAEQAALLRVAARRDSAINRQTVANPHLDRGRGSVPPPCTGSAARDRIARGGTR